MERVKALIRRTYRGNKPIAEKISFNQGDLEIEQTKMTVEKTGEAVRLTALFFNYFIDMIPYPSEL